MVTENGCDVLLLYSNSVNAPKGFTLKRSLYCPGKSGAVAALMICTVCPTAIAPGIISSVIRESVSSTTSSLDK